MSKNQNKNKEESIEYLKKEIKEIILTTQKELDVLLRNPDADNK